MNRRKPCSFCQCLQSMEHAEVLKIIIISYSDEKVDTIVGLVILQSRKLNHKNKLAKLARAKLH